jgi:hypothetical protein
MVIAVFGMRIVFPLAIVAIAAGLGPVEALRLSLKIRPATSRSSAARMSALPVSAGPSGAGRPGFLLRRRERCSLDRLDRGEAEPLLGVKAAEIALLLVVL